MEWGNHNSASLKCMSEAEELHLQLKVKIHPSSCVSLYISVWENFWAQKWKWAHYSTDFHLQSLQPSSSTQWAQLTCFPISFSIIQRWKLILSTVFLISFSDLFIWRPHLSNAICLD